MKEELALSTSRRIELQEITAKIDKLLQSSGIRNGICVLYCPHTTAGLMINENADPDVASDLERAYKAAVPEVRFDHAEGNSDSHFLASITGSSLSLLVEEGRLQLGRWQGIYFCEFDGPRSRRVWVKFSQ